MYLLDKLDGLTSELGMTAFTEGNKSTIDMFFITAALMAGTAGLPHVIVRFFTVPKVRDARISAGYALIFIALLYTTAPAVAAFARINIINNVDGMEYAEAPNWFTRWENSGLIAWLDKNNDGLVQYRGGAALVPTKRYMKRAGVNRGSECWIMNPAQVRMNCILIRISSFWPTRKLPHFQTGLSLWSLQGDWRQPCLPRQDCYW